MISGLLRRLAMTATRIVIARRNEEAIQKKQQKLYMINNTEFCNYVIVFLHTRIECPSPKPSWIFSTVSPAASTQRIRSSE